MKKDFYKDIKVDKIVADVKKGAGEVISSAKAVAQKVSNRDLKNIINNSKNNNEYKGTINFITVDGATTDFSDKDWEIPSFMNKTTKEEKKVYVKKYKMNKSAVINTLGKAKDKAIEGVNAVSSKLTSNEAKDFYASVRTKAIDLKDKASEKITKEAIPYVKSVADKVSKEDFQKIVKSVETGANGLRIAIIDKTAEYSDSFKKRFFSKGNDINPDEKEAIVDEKEAIVDEKEAIVDEKEAIVDEKEVIADEKEVIADKKESSKNLDTDDYLENVTRHCVDTEANNFDDRASKIVSNIEKTNSEEKNKDTVLKPVVVEADKEPTLLKPTEDGIDKKEIHDTNLKPELVEEDAPTEELNFDEIKEEAKPEFVEADKKEGILTKIGLAGLGLALLGGIKKGFNFIVNGFRAGGLKVGNTFSGIKNSFSGLKNKFKTKKTKSTGFKNILRNIKYAALTVGLTLAGLFGLSKANKHFGEWAANVVKPKTVDVNNDPDVTKAPSLPKTKDLSLNNPLTLTTTTEKVSLSSYDGYTFNQLLNATKDESQKESMKMAYNAIKGFNIDFASNYYDEVHENKPALSFDEVCVLMSVYNDYSADEIKSMFKGANINTANFKNIYSNARNQMIGALIMEDPAHPVNLTDFVRDDKSKAIIEERHSLLLKIKGETDETKRSQYIKEYAELMRKDYFDLAVNGGKDPNLGFMKYNAEITDSNDEKNVFIVHELDNAYIRLVQDHDLTNEEIDVINSAYICDKIDKKNETTSGIINSATGLIEGPTYFDYKEAVTIELKSKGAYNLENRDPINNDNMKDYVITDKEQFINTHPVEASVIGVGTTPVVGEPEYYSTVETVKVPGIPVITELPITSEGKAYVDEGIKPDNDKSREEGYAASKIKEEELQHQADIDAENAIKQAEEENKQTDSDLADGKAAVDEGKVPTDTDRVDYYEEAGYDIGAVKDLDTEGKEEEAVDPNDPEVIKAYEERHNSDTQTTPDSEQTPESTSESTSETSTETKPETPSELVEASDEKIEPIVDDGHIEVPTDPTLQPASEQEPGNGEELTNPSTDSDNTSYTDVGGGWEIGEIIVDGDGNPYEDPNAQAIVDEINSELEEEKVEEEQKVYERK